MIVRAEQAEDYAAVHALNEVAFGQREEADIVEALRPVAQPCVSLVAVYGDEIVGHILFTPVSVEPPGRPLSAMGLAPMAVAPARQRQGIGSLLVRASLEECRRLGQEAVVLVGHPQYYPRFGFRRASEWGLRCEFEAPDEAFMALELREGALAGRQGGVVKYQPVFRGA